MPILEELIEQLEAEKGIELCQLAAATIKRLNDAISESVDSRNDLIRDLYRSLAWAHRSLGSEPRLVRGQNDDYYREWHAANDLIQQMREAKK